MFSKNIFYCMHIAKFVFFFPGEKLFLNSDDAAGNTLVRASLLICVSVSHFSHFMLYDNQGCVKLYILVVTIPHSITKSRIMEAGVSKLSL